jgi:hypothetical protein
VPIPHDLDGTWCKVIGAMLCYALLVGSSRVPTTATSCNRDQADVRRRLRDAHVRIHVLIDCANVPSAAGSQPLSRQTFGTFEGNAGLQVGRKTLKDCRSLAMTESFHHGRVQSSNARRTGG